MKNKLYILSAFFVMASYAPVSLAQSSDNALPTISKTNSPKQLQSADHLPVQNLDTDTRSQNRLVINPMDVIKAKEEQNNKKGYWKSSELKDQGTSKEATELPKDASKEDSIEDHATPEASVIVEEIPIEQSAAQNKNNDAEIKPEPTKESIANNIDNQASAPPAAKKDNAPIIKKITAAQQSIPRPQVPERTWSVE